MPDIQLLYFVIPATIDSLSGGGGGHQSEARVLGQRRRRHLPSARPRAGAADG